MRREATVLLVVNKDWYFLSHRVPLAKALRKGGYRVIVAAGDTGRGAEIRQLGFEFEPVPFDRGSINPLREIRTVLALRKLYLRVRPAVVNHIAIKAYLYGCLAQLLISKNARCPIVNTITGQGYLFLGKRPLARLLRALVIPVGRILRRTLDPRFVVFNRDDRTYLIDQGLVSAHRCEVIPGSGVDIERFTPRKRAIPEIGGSDDFAGSPVVVFCSRLLRMKGVEELVEASSRLRRRGIRHRLVLSGELDSSNRDSISRETLAEWQSSGKAECIGFCEDTPTLLSNADVAVLPSHGGEGIPLFLLEAMACGLAIIGTDVPGIRDIVTPGLNGKLVPVGDVAALEFALEELLVNHETRRAYGAQSRQMVLGSYCSETIGQRSLDLFRRIYPAAASTTHGARSKYETDRSTFDSAASHP